MSRNSTLKDNKLIDKKDLRPDSKTLDFLKKFARSYYSEKKLPQSLSGVILN